MARRPSAAQFVRQGTPSRECDLRTAEKERRKRIKDCRRCIWAKGAWVRVGVRTYGVHTTRQMSSLLLPDPDVVKATCAAFCSLRRMPNGGLQRHRSRRTFCECFALCNLTLVELMLFYSPFSRPRDLPRKTRNVCQCSASPSCSAARSRHDFRAVGRLVAR